MLLKIIALRKSWMGGGKIFSFRRLNCAKWNVRFCTYITLFHYQRVIKSPFCWCLTFTAFPTHLTKMINTLLSFRPDQNADTRLGLSMEPQLQPSIKRHIRLFQGNTLIFEIDENFRGTFASYRTVFNRTSQENKFKRSILKVKNGYFHRNLYYIMEI